MIINKRKNKWIYIGLLCFLLLTSVISVRAEEKKGRILFLSSYSYGWDTVQMQIEGIKAVIGQQAVLDYEFMDTKRVNDETSHQQFYEGLKYRLSKVEPYDVIIVGDDAALLFVEEYREELFAEIPIVFEGINDEELALELAKDPLITGVLEKLSLEKNIEFGLNLYPEAKKVVAILDNSITGEAERKSFYQCADSYPELTFTEINCSELSTNNLKHRLRQIGQDSILIYIVMTEDADGKQYTNQEAIKVITGNAKVPALRMVEGGIGEGLLGGNVVSMSRSGEIAAEIAMEIINGTYSGDIGVVKESPNIYCVDELVMQKFKLDMKLLPEGTTIVNHQPTFLERNKEVLVPGSFVIGALLLIILWAVFDNIRRRRLMEELQEARNIMESASQHDFLTGIPNRSKFMEDLENLIEEGTPCTVFMMDIDDFKHINDNYGHSAGDEALKQLADRLKEMRSQILTPYRFAGDEFIMIMRSNQSKIVEKAAYQTRQLFTKPFRLAGEDRKVCGSIGIASFPKDADSIEQLIICADSAMYQVKKSGKNNFAFYDPAQVKPE